MSVWKWFCRWFSTDVCVIRRNRVIAIRSVKNWIRSNVYPKGFFFVSLDFRDRSMGLFQFYTRTHESVTKTFSTRTLCRTVASLFTKTLYVSNRFHTRLYRVCGRVLEKSFDEFKLDLKKKKIQIQEMYFTAEHKFCFSRSNVNIFLEDSLIVIWLCLMRTF